MTRQLLKGNEAIAEAAIRAGVEAYFGYPITPQTEVLEYFSRRMPELGRVFVQAESEVAAINMVYGAACTGKRVMSSSSSPGVSLMMEGISYVAGTEIPLVLVDVMRGGPGLGNIAPSQGDYNQIVRGGGHGDYNPIVLAPASVQESIDFMALAFDLAEAYRAIVIVLVDGNIGQMMEPAELPPMRPVRRSEPDWAVTGAKGRDRRILSSIYIKPEDEEIVNLRLLRRWEEITAHEIRYKEYFTEDAQYLVIGFGTAGRVSFSAVRAARDAGIRAGLLRPVTLSPFPEAKIRELADQVEGILVVEMNAGQMLDDVLRLVGTKVPVEFYGRLGGMVPFPEEVLDEIHRMAYQPSHPNGNPRQSWLKRMEMLDV
ncbi:MAG TPA: 3-methyl-2-oxobutanoate dehydrogenase subunit VorB [Anaerolineales bacterium]